MAKLLELGLSLYNMKIKSWALFEYVHLSKLYFSTIQGQLTVLSLIFFCTIPTVEFLEGPLWSICICTRIYQRELDHCSQPMVVTMKILHVKRCMIHKYKKINEYTYHIIICQYVEKIREKIEVICFSNGIRLLP